MSKRKSLSIVDKFEILNENNGVKKIDVAKKYGIPTLLKNRENIVIQVQESSLIGNRKRIKVCVYEEVNKAILK